MDQHHHRSRSSSRSELPNRPSSICVSLGHPHKAHCSLLSCGPPSPSTSAYPPSPVPSHSHPAITSTPQTNEANALFTPHHYITSSLSLSTPRRSSYLPSPFSVPSSPVLPALLTMTPQVLVPPPAPLNPPPHDQPRPSSRSERLLRETLRRDRAASISPRSRMPRAESRSGHVASTSSEMFHCACTDSDDEGDLTHDTSPHVSLLFTNLPQHRHQRPVLQHAPTPNSSADVPRRHESGLREKERMAPLCHSNSYRGAALQNPFESYPYGPTVAQKRDRHADRESTWSSTEVST